MPSELADTPEIREAFGISDRHNWTQEELDAYEYWEMRAQKLLIEQEEHDKTRAKLAETQTLLVTEREEKEQAKAREEEAKTREEEERRQKEEAKAREEEAKAQAERAIRTLAETLGISEDEARAMLGS